MVSKDRARRLQRIYDKHHERRELREVFLRNVDYIRGEASIPHPKSHNPKYEGTAFSPWEAVDGNGNEIDPRDVEDLSEP